MTREERMAARTSRLEARRAERAASANVAQPSSPPPPPRLTRQGAQESTVRKPCGCTRSKG